MRRFEIVTAAISVPIDFAMVVLAGLTAYSLRYSGTVATLRPALAELAFRRFFLLTLLVAVWWLLCLTIAGLYTLGRRSAIAELGRTILASSTAITAVIVFIFFQRELFSSRFIVLAGWLLAILYITIARLVIRGITRILKRNGKGLQDLLVVGVGETADRIVTDLYAGRAEGYRLVGRLTEFHANEVETFRSLVQEKHAEAVLLASTTLTGADTLALLESAQQLHLDFAYVADLFATHAGHLEMRTLFGQPVVEVKRTKLDGWGRIWKRFFDLFCSSLLLVVLSPIFLIVTLLVKLGSSGPVFFRAQRVGERGKTFTLYKFRSMIQNAHSLKPALMQQNERSDGPLFKITNDPRITGFGRFLRRTSLDELPQLFNVLTGRMSLVGPRPHEPEEVAHYQPWHQKLLTIKPGMTGMAQVSGRATLSFDEEARLDIAYLENWSFANDIMILLRTPGTVLSRRAAV